MKLFEFLVATLLCALPFPVHVNCDCEGQLVSLYNIGSGYMPYAKHDGANKYLGFDDARSLLGSDYPERTSWTLIYNSNGSVSFKNLRLPSLCIKYYQSGSGVIQETCNTENDSKFQFELRLHKSGAVQVVFGNLNECLYNNSGDIYNGPCLKNDRNYLWALIPPLKNDDMSRSDDSDELLR